MLGPLPASLAELRIATRVRISEALALRWAVRVHRHDHCRWRSSTAGEPMDRTTASRDWHKQALEDAGLRDVPLHSLRTRPPPPGCWRASR
jgi:hypothetical protein